MSPAVIIPVLVGTGAQGTLGYLKSRALFLTAFLRKLETYETRLFIINWSGLRVDV